MHQDDGPSGSVPSDGSMTTAAASASTSSNTPQHPMTTAMSSSHHTSISRQPLAVGTPDDPRIATPQSITGTASEATGTPRDHENAPTPPHQTSQGAETSSGSAAMVTATTTAAAAAAAAEKKQRACDPCRGLKVKCEWPTDDVLVGSAHGNPCRRCTKSGRTCIVSVRARTNERNKRTDTRVSELEKRIDELTASLSAKGDQANSNKIAATAAAIQGFRSAMDKTERNRRNAAWTGSPVDMVETVQEQAKAEAPPLPGAERPHKRRRETELDTATETAGLGIEDDRTHQRPKAPMPGRAYTEFIEKDCIDRGIITVEDSELFFQRYREGMVMHMPAVVFPPSTRISDIRRSTPVLFLAIMAAAASEKQEIQRQLVSNVMCILSELTIIDGKKSLELVQALHVSVIWYWPPEHFEELKFYQLVNLSVSIAIDIGLGVRPKGSAKKMGVYGWREQQHQPPPMPSTVTGTACPAGTPPANAQAGAVGFMSGGRRSAENAESLVARRSWLTCYYLSSNAAVSLRRPNLVRWSPFMGDCVRVLETSPEAAPTDRILCTLVRMNHLSEDIGYQFSPDEGFLKTGLGDLRTQVTLRGFQTALETLRRETPPENMLPAVVIGFEMTGMYLHEVVLQSDEADESRDQYMPPHNQDSALPSQPLIQGGSRTLTTSHVSCIGALLAAVTSLFDAFLSMPISSVRCLPVFNFVRIAYAVVILVKIHFSASVPGSEVAKVIPKEEVKLEFYIDRLLEKFKATVKGNRSRPAAKFLVVLIMLKRWAASEETMPNRERPVSQEGTTTASTGGDEAHSDDNNEDSETSPEQQRQSQQQQQQPQQQADPQQPQSIPQHPSQQPITPGDYPMDYHPRLQSVLPTNPQKHHTTTTPPAPYDGTAWQPPGSNPSQSARPFLYNAIAPHQYSMGHHLPSTTAPSAGGITNLPTPVFVPSGMPPSSDPPMFPPPMGGNGGPGWGGGVDLVMPGGSYGDGNPNIDFEGLMTNFGMGLPAEYVDAYKPYLGESVLMELDDGMYQGGM